MHIEVVLLIMFPVVLPPLVLFNCPHIRRAKLNDAVVRVRFVFEPLVQFPCSAISCVIGVCAGRAWRVGVYTYVRSQLPNTHLLAAPGGDRGHALRQGARGHALTRGHAVISPRGI